jgi:hypothetical protein
MIVAGTPQGFILEDPSNFRALKVQMPGPAPTTPSELPEFARNLGRWTGTDLVFIDERTLRNLAGERANDPSWQVQFTAMINYAGTSGWLDADGCIQSHVEYVNQYVVDEMLKKAP